MDAKTRTAPAEPVLYHPEPVAPLVPTATLPYLSPVPVQGAVEAQTPDGHRVWLLVSRIEPTGPAASPEATVSPSVPTWAKTTALLSLSLSGSSVMGAYALGLFAEGLAELVAALVLLAKFGFVLALVLGLVVIVAKRKTAGGNVTATATSTATARGFLAKATATATATATAKK
ncbi:hypothetical protein OVA19_00130 [Streptomyces sp. SL203]|nr:hypothetical protein [Streptomyces sp. SL203]MCY1649229.1 hypothetical protein [Streptomyces sp. SL203]